MIDKKDNVSNISSELLVAKEEARVQKIISDLHMYSNDPEELTRLYTNILFEENIVFILTKVSQDPIFVQHFPEFYTRNQFGENVINCQQNNSYHKYGVFKHILYTIEYVGSKDLPIGDWQRKILKWTMFLHDIGKPYVKIINDDKTDSFFGHDDKSVELATGILDRFSFTEEEKKIILTLIKYHDRYLNEGEVIFDNLQFLASELNDNKELFFLLIDVKEADAKAKSIEVYNKYKITRKKYLEFLNSYFSNNTSTTGQQTQEALDERPAVSVDTDNVQEEVGEDTDSKIMTLKLKTVLDNAIDKKGISVKYQPIVDLKTKLVHGYETFTHVEEANIRIIDLLNYAVNVEKYDRLQQTLFINAVKSFNMQQAKESKLVFLNIDYNSYNSYVNKPRLYDIMRAGKVVVSFHSYEKVDINDLKNTVNLIHENRGFVALEDFGRGSLDVSDINVLDVDYIVPDMSFIRDINKMEEKQEYIRNLVTFCIGKLTNVIAVGVQNVDELKTIMDLGVRYAQGNYIAKPEFAINIINASLSDILNISDNDMLV